MSFIKLTYSGLLVLCFIYPVNVVFAFDSIGLKASGCDDLSSQFVTNSVDYANQVQPIWNANCANCHTNGGSNGGLRLDSGQSFDNLVNVTALNAPSLKRVLPSDPDNSFVFQKVNCSQPDGGSRMPISSSLSLSNQAIIRDWILQGALEVPSQNSAPTANSDNATGSFGDDITIDVLANDSDPDDDNLTITSVDDGANGNTQIVNNRIVYSPNSGFSGSDSFTYSISDGNQGQDSANVTVTVDPALFDMNFGLSGSWVNAETPGQGFAFDIVPSESTAVVYWYTYDIQGNGTQAWLFGAAQFFGNRAEVPLSIIENGIFDNPQAPDAISWGTFILTFDSCTTGHVSYTSDIDNVSGSFNIVRITDDQMCQAIIDAEAAL